MDQPFANTLADEFMNDFDDEEEEEEVEIKENLERDSKKPKTSTSESINKSENLLLKKLTDITNIRNNEHFIRLMKEIDVPDVKGSQKEFEKISTTNELIVKLIEDINDLYDYIKDIYSLKFKELAELETNKITFIKVVMRIGNETDLTKIELNDLLENSILLVITVAATTTKGRKLTEEELESVMMACKEALYLDEEKGKLLKFVEGKMEHLAPNLTTLVGSKVAASLICDAGSLSALSKLHSNAIQSLGVNRKNMLGMSNKKENFLHYGHIYQAPLILTCPIQHRTKALRNICGRVALAARFDSFSNNTNDQQRDMHGKKYYEEISNKISKWQEPPPPKKPKPLAAPDSKKKNKRGGKVARKRKQLLEQTEVRKQMNRVSMNPDEVQDDYGDEEEGMFGMLGKSMKGSTVRISAQEKNIIKKVTNKKNRDEQQLTAGIRTKLGYKTGLKTLTSGAKSTLTLDDPNGMTFIATTGPSPLAENSLPSQTKYFTKTGNFLLVSQKNKNSNDNNNTNNQDKGDKEFIAPLPKSNLKK